MQKKIIFIFCTRLFDFRYLKSTNIIDHLSKNLDIILFVDYRHKNLIEKSLNYNYKVKSILYKEEEYERGSKNLSYNLCKLIQLIFSFTYANLKIKENRTRKLHVNSFLLKRKKVSFFKFIFSYLIIILSKLACELSLFRQFLQYIFSLFAPKIKHQEDFIKYNPISCLFCSFGFGIDTLLMHECKENKVKIITAVQSWDKTSSKGFPIVKPDYAIVWSKINKIETQTFLDFPKEKIFVEGAPLWDLYFTRKYKSKKGFMKKFGLNQKNKLISFSIGSPSYHEGNKKIIYFFQRLRKKFELNNISIILREHPGYINYKKEYHDLQKSLKSLLSYRNFVFMKLEPDQNNEIYLYKEADSKQLVDMFNVCDLSISIVSSHMIEASILDKPSINIEFGKWFNSMYDFELKNYTAEHIMRVYETNAIYRANNERDLESFIFYIIKNPNEKKYERKRLIEQEITVNRGFAAKAVASRIYKLSLKEN